MIYTLSVQMLDLPGKLFLPLVHRTFSEGTRAHDVSSGVSFFCVLQRVLMKMILIVLLLVMRTLCENDKLLVMLQGVDSRLFLPKDSVARP